jgi:putative regulator of septum formation
VRRALAVAAVLAAALTSCTGGGDPAADPSPTGAPASDSSPPAPTATPTRAAAAPRPRVHACYRLGFDQAIAPTSAVDPVGCGRPHTSLTYAIGTLDAVEGGHLLAVDSRHVQNQVARDCPRRLPGFLGGGADALRLSMLRAVWFTPSVKESEAGADWYRCDVIAVAGDERLARLTGRLAGALSRPEGRDRYGMCGTAEPGTEGFSRVICSTRHSWRALRTVGLGTGAYPGGARVRDAGQDTCRDAGRAVAADALTFKWGYEWPSRQQWDEGQHYGLCWAPD